MKGERQQPKRKEKKKKRMENNIAEFMYSDMKTKTALIGARADVDEKLRGRDGRTEPASAAMMTVVLLRDTDTCT